MTNLCSVFLLLLFGVTNLYGQELKSHPKSPQQNQKQEKLGTLDAPLYVKGDITSTKGKVEAEDDAKERKEKMAIDQTMANYAGYMFFLAAIQAGMFFWQLRLMINATEKAGASADAAKIAANAALAALDKPWLVLEGVECNFDTWLQETEPLRARFKIANYGSAPAILLSVKATLFLSPNPIMNSGFPRPLPTTMREFPAASGLREFINSESQEVKQGIRDSIAPTLRYKAYSVLDSTIVVDAKSKTETYFSHHLPTIEPGEKGIPIEYAANIYLIGRVLYAAPTEKGSITFCYEFVKPENQFKVVYGAPFNQTQRQYADNEIESTLAI